jgi:DNA-directed RNA polymerase alpha subunit
VKDTITQDRYKEYVELRKRKEHHIFTVESTNSISAAELFKRAIRILRHKCTALRNML